MKHQWVACVTHDIDVMSFKGFKHHGYSVLGAGIEVIERHRSFMNFCSFVRRIYSSEFNNVDSLLLADGDTPVTFFVAMQQGNGITYTKEDIEPVVRWLTSNGVEVGLHGQTGDLQEQHDSLTDMLHSQPHGIRMHKLDFRNLLGRFLDDIGYLYDTSIEVPDKFKLFMLNDKTVEIPLNVCDSTLFQKKKMDLSIDDAKYMTREMLELAKSQGGVFTILMHQKNYSPQYPRHFEWFNWLIDILDRDKTCLKLTCSVVAKYFMAKELPYQESRK